LTITKLQNRISDAKDNSEHFC